MGIWDNREVAMKEQNEMPVENKSLSSRFRYWTTPPESLTIDVADIEPFVPRANWIVPAPDGLTVKIPAEKIFARNVPRIPLWLLAELLPDYVSSSDGMVKLPAARLAVAYRLVEHVEELIPEPPPVPITPPPLPEMVPLADLGTPQETRCLGEFEVSPVFATPQPPGIALTPPAVQATPDAPAPNDQPPVSDAPASPLELPAPEETPIPASKFPPRRVGSFIGLPFFRRKTPVAVAQPVPSASAPVELPSGEPPRVEPPLVLPETPGPLPPEEPPVAAVAEIPEPVPQTEPDLPPSPFLPVRLLRTEHFPVQTQGQEIVEQEPLQALFLTEEPMTVSRVIELCGGLPGVNSCVLAHGSVVVASHNAPDGVDLVSMSAHAADMLRAMRDSSARMGVGTVPAVTLHTEKGVISFFNREDLTMLVFHRDRGFVPGVREKMAAVLGELTKARLTLPVGGDEAG